MRQAGNLTNLGSAVQSPIPANVVDQIWLWDRERARVSLQEVYEHKCHMPGEFAAVVQYAKEWNCHAWSSERKQMVFISYGQAGRVEKFIHQWRAAAALHGQQEDS